VGTVTDMVAFVAGLGNFTFTMTMGWFVSRGGYAPFFVMLGLCDGATVLWTLVKPVKTAEPKITRQQVQA
jgi:MFS transporter, ACS family, hexuronate transporter